MAGDHAQKQRRVTHRQRERPDLIDAAIATAEGLGAAVREITLPGAVTRCRRTPARQRRLPTSHGSTACAWVRLESRATRSSTCPAAPLHGFGSEVKRRIMLGTYVLSAGYYDAYYGTAQRVRTLVRRDYQEAFAQVDVIATPASPTVAFGIGERIDDPWAMYACDILTVPVNLAGLPGISIPSALREGLPVGLQLVGDAFSENRILAAAHALEQAIQFDPVPPALRAARSSAAPRGSL